jgi:hypothetical protein
MKKVTGGLPFGWEKKVDEEGKILFVNNEKNIQSFTDPRLAFAQEVKKLTTTFFHHNKLTSFISFRRQARPSVRSSTPPPQPPQSSTERTSATKSRSSRAATRGSASKQPNPSPTTAVK